MKLSKVNRERRQTVYFTDSRGIRSVAVVTKDNFNTAKKPPRLMQHKDKQLLNTPKCNRELET